MRSAIFNEVLQFFLIWAGASADSDPRPDRSRRLDGLKAKILQNLTEQHVANPGAYTHLWSTLGSFSDNPMGINWAGIVFGLGAVISMGYWTTDFLVVQRVLSAKDLRSAELAPIIGAAFKMMVPFIVILPGLLGLALAARSATGNLLRLVPADLAWSNAGQAQGLHGYDEVLPLMLARYCGPGLLGLGITALIAGFMSGMAGNVSAFTTVWTYDIYGALINKNAIGRVEGQMGRWCTVIGVVDQHRHGVPGDARAEHHGLRSGAVQLLHRAAVRHGDSRHAVETRHPCRRLLGICWPEPSLRSACTPG